MTKLTNAEQLEAINRIMNKVEDKPPMPEYRFKFGKYNGVLLEKVIEEDPSYIQWFYYNYASIPKKVEVYLEDHVIGGYQ